MELDGPIKIVSVGQFRPEKDHALQIRAMFELRQIVDDAVWKRVRYELNHGHSEQGNISPLAGFLFLVIGLYFADY